MSEAEETWRPSHIHARYAVSNLGRVRGARGRINATCENGNGYLMVRVGAKMISVHRMVADAFYGPIPEKMTVNHRNGVKSDNRAANLEIVTRSENIRHAFATGLKRPAYKGAINPHAQGERNPKAKLVAADVQAIRREYADGAKPKAIAAKYGVTGPLISNIVARRCWTHVP